MAIRIHALTICAIVAAVNVMSTPRQAGITVSTASHHRAVTVSCVKMPARASIRLMATAVSAIVIRVAPENIAS